MNELFGPYGFTLSAVCICVVFGVLLLLSLVYTLIGKIFERKVQSGTATEDEMPVPEANNEVHDVESGIITINRSNQPYGKLPKPVIIPMNVKLGHATAHSDEYLLDSAAAASHQHTIGSGTVICPLPGVIIGLSVKVGDNVVPGQRVATLEAMKMENAIEAERSGVVKAIHVNVGDSVLEGAKIVTIQ